VWALAICLIAGLAVNVTSREPFTGTAMAAVVRMTVLVSQLSVVAAMWMPRDRARAALFLLGATMAGMVLIVVLTWRSVHIT
jgi:hypothetical protein